MWACSLHFAVALLRVDELPAAPLVERAIDAERRAFNAPCHPDLSQRWFILNSGKAANKVSSMCANVVKQMWGLGVGASGTGGDAGDVARGGVGRGCAIGSSSSGSSMVRSHRSLR